MLRTQWFRGEGASVHVIRTTAKDFTPMQAAAVLRRSPAPATAAAATVASAASARDLVAAAEALAADDAQPQAARVAALAATVRLLNPARRRVAAAAGDDGLAQKLLLASASIPELLFTIRTDSAVQVQLEADLADISPFRRAERIFKTPPPLSARAGYTSPLLQRTYPAVSTVADAVEAGAVDAGAPSAAVGCGVVCISPALPASFVGAGDCTGADLRVAARGGIFELADRPGVYILPGLLTVRQQEHWIRVACRLYLERPNRRNVDSVFDPDASNMYAGGSGLSTSMEHAQPPGDELPFADLLWRRYVERRKQQRGQLGAVGTASAPPLVLPSIAWATLGVQYDWTARQYHLPGDPDYELHCRPHESAAPRAPSQQGQQIGGDSFSNDVVGSGHSAPTAQTSAATTAESASAECTRWSAPFPPRLHTLSANIAGLVNAAASVHHGASAGPLAAPTAVPSPLASASASPPLPPSAALLASHGLPMTIDATSGIVNVYQSAKKKLPMGAHVDDMERTVAHPVISLSLGCPAVFLVGGATKESPVIPVILRSGDAIIMSGDSRLALHGVARIFDGGGETAGSPLATRPLFSGSSSNSAIANSCSCCGGGTNTINGGVSPGAAELLLCDCRCCCHASAGARDPAAAAGEPGYYASVGVAAEEEEAAFASFVQTTRINVNVRQVLA